MPLARYFFFVGGTLLALLFFSAAYLPKPDTGATVPEVFRPVVRIHTDRKLPERIVIDTSIPTIVPPPMVVAEIPATPRAMDAMARITPAELKYAELKKPEPTARPKRKVAKRQVRQPMIAYAQVPPRLDFDLFARN